MKIPEDKRVKPNTSENRIAAMTKFLESLDYHALYKIASDEVSTFLFAKFCEQVFSARSNEIQFVINDLRLSHDSHIDETYAYAIEFYDNMMKP